MRKLISILLTTLMCFAMFAIVGCSTASDPVTMITDLADYADMRSGGDKIDVQFENGKQHGFQFSIEDQTSIDEIVNLVLTTRLMSLGNEFVAPGDNTSFTVHQGIKSYGISLSGVTANNNRYAFSTDELRNKITSIAETKGAFDAEVGVIYKVMDLQDIESVKEERITVEDKTALLNVIESRFGDCRYLFIYDNEDMAEAYSSGLNESESNVIVYNDTVAAGKGKLLFMYHIYQKHHAASYYITSPSMSEYHIGHPVSVDFMFVLWHTYFLKLTVLS